MILKIKNRSLPFFLGIISFVGIFLDEKIVPYLLVLLIFTLFFEKNKGVNFRSNKSILIPYIIVISVFVIYTLLSPDPVLALKVLERQISLLLIPLIVAFAKWGEKRIIFFFKVFIITAFIIGAASILKFIWFIFFNSEWISHMAEEKGSKLLYLQYKFPHVIGTHPTYWSYLLISAIIILWSNNNLKVFKSKYFTLFLLVFFNINLLLLASRTPLFINLLVHIFFLVRITKKEKISGVKKFIILILFFATVFGALKLPLLSNKLDIVQNDERLYHWPMAYKTIKQNFFILGEGLGQSNEVIKKEIITKGDERIRYFGYDLHNQYLRVYIDMGILGILSLLILLSYPLFIRRKEFLFGNTLNIPFFLLFSFSLMTESYLYRLKGIVFFAALSSILYLCAFGINEDSSEKIATHS